MTGIPAGWYDDPLGSKEERYWDGSNWTSETRPLLSSTQADTTGGNSAGIDPRSNGDRTTRSSAVIPFLIGALLVMSAAALFLFLNRGSDVPTQPSPTDNSSVVPQTTTQPAATTEPAVETTLSASDEAAHTTTTRVVTTTSSLMEQNEEIRIAPSMMTATCQGNDGVEGDLATPVSYSVANLVDGVRSTAWRCSTNEVLAGSITIDLGAPVKLTSVSLLPGYDKVDPFNEVDRFIQNHRVAQVRWTFDDSSIIVDYVDSRDIQATQVDVTTQTIQLQVLDYWPSSGTLARDMIAFSEIALQGVR